MDTMTLIWIVGGAAYLLGCWVAFMVAAHLIDTELPDVEDVEAGHESES